MCGCENKFPEYSKDGLDAKFGHKQSKTLILDVKEDTHVEAGESADTNFGDANYLDFKGMADGVPTKMHRAILLKFDLSNIEGNRVNSATVTLYCTLMEDKTTPTAMHVYGCFSNEWNENEVTFNTAPKGDRHLDSGVLYKVGYINFNVTDFVNEQLAKGEKEVSFRFEGDESSVRRLYFGSKEAGNAPRINVTFGDCGYSTELKFDKENPWQVAYENYAEWNKRWEEIKQGGDDDAELVVKRDEEYPLITEATYGSETDGYNTRYRIFQTRLISTLKGYTENTAETELYDEYGGYTGGERFEATGYFYTKKIGNRWWTVDPLGYPYYRVACVAIFTGSPLQKENLLKKYGSYDKWAQEASDRLYELGYNSAGGWSEIDLLSKAKRPLSQTKVLYAVRRYAKTLGLDVGKAGHTEFLHGVMPVFDPDFVGCTEDIVERETKDYVGAPYIYGWFGDNELPADITMLENSLKLDPSDPRFAYSYANAWTFMYMKTGKKEVTISDVTEELRLEYRAMIYDKYFSVVKRALDKFVPMHQFIGCRFVDNCFKDEYIMRVAGHYCDVVTLNYYSVWQGDPVLLANMQKWAGKPFAITEWYAKGMDVWEKDNRMTNKSGAGWTVRNQEKRGEFYQNYTLQLLECKGCVGFDWFQYLDNDPVCVGADLSNLNSNKGICDTRHEEYTEMTALMANLNNQKYNLIKFFDER